MTFPTLALAHRARRALHLHPSPRPSPQPRPQAGAAHAQLAAQPCRAAVAVAVAEGLLAPIHTGRAPPDAHSTLRHRTRQHDPVGWRDARVLPKGRRHAVPLARPPARRCAAACPPPPEHSLATPCTPEHPRASSAARGPALEAPPRRPLLLPPHPTPLHLTALAPDAQARRQSITRWEESTGCTLHCSPRPPCPTKRRGSTPRCSPCAAPRAARGGSPHAGGTAWWGGGAMRPAAAAYRMSRRPRRRPSRVARQRRPRR